MIVGPLRIGLIPFQMGFLWLINGGDPNYLLTGMILQVGGWGMGVCLKSLGTRGLGLGVCRTCKWTFFV